MVKWFSDLIELGYKELNPLEFYRDIFPKGELQEKGIYNDLSYCGIAVEVTNQRDSNNRQIIYRHTITDDLEKLEELLKSDNFVLLAPISYVGKARTTSNSRIMYAFALEIDNLRYNLKTNNADGLKDLLHQMNNKILPKANYLVTSGNGVHLYFLLDKPIRLFENVRKSLTRYKRFITRQFWNRYITFDYEESKIQYESAFQGFRLAGGVAKNGARTHVFKLSDNPITIEELNSYVYQEKDVEDSKIRICYNSDLTLTEAKKKYPEWYEKRIVNKEKKGTWIAKRCLYDWWLRRIREEIKVGHRYHALMLLSTYAIKCNISYEELEKDCLDLLEKYDNLSEREDNRFTIADVMDALQIFHDKDYISFPINSIKKLSGLQIEKNKRNYRKQKEHLRGARALRDIYNPNWRDGNGRPKGSGEKKYIVLKWRLRNPEGKKSKCIKETKISKPTVYKWWNLKEKNIFSEIPICRKMRLWRQMSMRYITEINPILSETEKRKIRKNRQIDFIHEMIKMIGESNYKLAKQIYIERREKKKVFLNKEI